LIMASAPMQALPYATCLPSQSSRRLHSRSSQSATARPSQSATAPPSHRVAAPDLRPPTMRPAKNAHLEGLNAVLFLDVDGVLHPPNPKHERLMFRASCMELLRDVLQQSGAHIVLSTTWRLSEEGRTALAAKLTEHGCPLFVSRTPSIAQFQRPKEILAWVAKYQPQTWVAVDDWPLHEDPKMDGHFVQTRNRYGLQPDTAARIAQLFMQQRRGEGGTSAGAPAGHGSCELPRINTAGASTAGREPRGSGGFARALASGGSSSHLVRK